MNDKSHWVRYAAVEHENATPEIINRGLKDDDWGVRDLAGIRQERFKKGMKGL